MGFCFEFEFYGNGKEIVEYLNVLHVALRGQIISFVAGGCLNVLLYTFISSTVRSKSSLVSLFSSRVHLRHSIEASINS